MAEPIAPAPCDLLVRDAALVATVDAGRSEIAGGWVAVTGGLVSGVGGPGDPAPAARETIDARGCLVTPGLVNSHHHLFQNLTRAWRPMTRAPLFGWLAACFPQWVGLDADAVHVSAWVGLAELALSGCTTSTDMMYFHVRGAGDFIDAEIEAAVDLGVRFHPSRGAYAVGVDNGGIAPMVAVQTVEEILADSERLVHRYHDRSHGAMVRIAFGPCTTFALPPDGMRELVALAEHLDVRIHTHLSESADDDDHAMAHFGTTDFGVFERLGLDLDRTWVAHCVWPTDEEIGRLARAGVAVAHCPSSNCVLSSGIAPVADFRRAGVPVGLGVDGSSSSDAASLWMEARQALLVGKLRDGADSVDARAVLEMATRGGAACLGRVGELGELSVGAVADLAVWSLDGPSYAGALDDPIEAWLRCGPGRARDTVVAGRAVVRGGLLTHGRLDEMLGRHRVAATRLQQVV